MRDISKAELLLKIAEDPNDFADQFIRLYALISKRIADGEALSERIDSLNRVISEKDKLLLATNEILTHYKALTVH